MMRLVAFAVFGVMAAGKDPAFFESRIRPLLAKHCYACHSQTAMAGLRLDSRSAILQGGKSGPAVVPGKPEESLLLQAVEYTHARLRMPPKGKLDAPDLQNLKTWIAAGAEWPEDKGGTDKPLWSLRPIRKPNGGSIDSLIAAKLAAEGLSQGPLADKRTLIRRATFDLLGLPPSPADIQAFLADDSPDAFAKVVDRLLASPHYGERWARHWLDLARYSDGAQGARDDDPYPNAFRYRDWVVQSFNDDLPYNEFVRAQIAADHLPGQRHRAARGFQALG